MEIFGVRELQQHASAVLRRVKEGETIGITDRGQLVAVLAPPETASGTKALIAAGRVERARPDPCELPPPVRSPRRIAEVLNQPPPAESP